MVQRRGGQSGRIHVHERTVNDAAEIIGANIEIASEHQDEIIATEQSSMLDKTRREHRNRIARIYNWWMKNYPEYFEIGTRVLSKDEKNDPVKYHHRNNRDIRYTGLNVKHVKAYLSQKKTKRVRSDGKAVLASPSDISKYNDAIKWGSLRAGEPLPSSYY